MKKLLLIITLFLSPSIYITSCGNKSVQTIRTETDSIRHADSLAADSAVEIGYALRRAGLYFKRDTTKFPY